MIGALTLLWSMSRLGGRPTAKVLGIATRLIAEHGVLGDGSIPRAKEAIAGASLRPESELREGLAAYAAFCGGSDAADAPEPMVAAIGVQNLAWVLGEA